MAQQLDLLTEGRIIPTALHTEMQQSYLEYAMSVIVGRALPDVRDGLKPVHRRILYAMHELGLLPDRPFRKCARVVGDVLGKYHPHGDQAVYDALVRMVQEFNSRYPVLAGHGNFGSVDNDPPAAMRYTETRLAAIGQEVLLTEIDDATVDFTDNFDSSQEEPVVLPAQLPILLLNGCSGIAVGMATNVPPHNLGEVVDALIALTDNPDLKDDALFRLIPGPDFPTAGEILGNEGIKDAYRTGRGSITLRGVAQLETLQTGRGNHRRNAIVITELPYQVNKAGWIEKIAELVNQGRIEGIAELRDESDREGMRVVIELKREANPHDILQHLYRLTPLQINFGAIFLALVDGQPRQLSLRELLQQFLSFREDTLTRRYTHELQQTENRAHIVQGLLTALEHIDGVIDCLRRAPDGSSAKTEFQTRFQFSDRQAEAILSMPLRRLTGLEQDNLRTEFAQLNQRIQELQGLLGDRRELLKALKKDIRALKRRFNDPRRTRILTPEDQAKITQGWVEKAPEPAPNAEETALELTHRGYIQRRSVSAFQRRQRSQDDPSTSPPGDAEDGITQSVISRSDQTLLAFTSQGKAYGIPVDTIPMTARRSRGTPLISLLPPAAQGNPEELLPPVLLPDDPPTHSLILLTQQGRIKRLSLEEFTHLTSRGLTTLKLKDGDTLMAVHLATRQQPSAKSTPEHLVLATSGGRLLRFPLDDLQVPLSSRTNQGQPALRLTQRDTLVGSVVITPDSPLLLISAQGYGKRIPSTALRLGRRGDLGMAAFAFSVKSDRLVGITAAREGAIALLETTADRLIQLPVDSVPMMAKGHPAEPCVSLNPQEHITAVHR